MDDENIRSLTFTTCDDTLRGYRKRWIRRSQSEASGRFSNNSGFRSEPSGTPAAQAPTLEADNESWLNVGSYNAPSIHDSEL